MKRSRLLFDALETFPNFVIVDRSADIVYLNQSYAALLGITVEAAIGRPVTEVIPGTRMPEILRTQKAEIGHLMTLYDHTQKKNITIACNRVPIFRDGQLIGAAAVTIIQDVVATVDQLNSELFALRKENEYFRHELKLLRSQPDCLNRIIGHSSALRELKQTISDYAASNLPILITGETGVGKELFARAVHELSPRRLNPYIKINCAAIPAELLESELFGYEAGAFSGASRNGKIGKFELANNGTLLLDEIGEMPMTLQSKLLRVLQEQEIERIGGLKSIRINVRIVCCTNQNLRQLIREKKFRSDLYYRINTVELAIPPLRERREDIPELADFFLRRHNETHQETVEGLEPEVLSLFRRHSWPGNIRELEHTMERLCTISGGRRIKTEDCGFLRRQILEAEQLAASAEAAFDTEETTRVSIVYNRQGTAEAAQGGGQQAFARSSRRVSDRAAEETADRDSLMQRIRETEREALVQALLETKGNKAQAARLLGIDRSSLYYKLKKFGLS